MVVEVSLKRQTWIDSWKGILILMVVLGHVAGGGCHLATGLAVEFLRMVYFLIYAFHMPAFFFLAGWMWRDQSLKALVRKRFVRLMLPYFSVGVISIFLFALVGGRQVMDAAFTSAYYKVSVTNNGAILQNLLSLIQGGGWPGGRGFRYNTVLWFLPCMFMTQIVYAVLRRLIRKRILRWVLGGALFVLASLLSQMRVANWVWGLDKVPYYLVFVLLGDILSQMTAGRMPRLNLINAVLLVVGFGVAVWLVAYLYVIRNWLIYPARLAIALCGIYLSMVFAQAMRGRAQTWLCAAGVCSLTIMLWHKFFVVAAQVKVPFVSATYRSGLLGSALATVLITLGATAGCCFFAKIWDVALLKVKSGMSHAA